MRAALLSNFGDLPEAADVSPPERADGHALVRIGAAPINKLDLFIASGNFYGASPEPPYVPGVEGVGTVVEADGLEEGTRVWFAFEHYDVLRGSMGELCAIEEARTVVLDNEIDDVAAAGLGLTGVAAWMSLSHRARVKPGEQVLVLGAAGAVGQIALQAARILGAGRVIGASRSDEGRAIAGELGADAVVDTSGADVNAIASRIKSACEGPLTLVIDPTWGSLAEASVHALAPGGRLVNFGSSAGGLATLDSAVIRSNSLSVLGYTNLSLSFEEMRGAITSLHAHAAQGQVELLVEKVKLDDVSSAFDRAGGSPHRKLIVVP